MLRWQVTFQSGCELRAWEWNEDQKNSKRVDKRDLFKEGMEETRG